VTGILIATHGAVATALRDAAVELLGEHPEGLVAVEISESMDHSAAWEAMLSALDSVDTGDGTLVLVDMFGSTPATIALALLAEREAEVITGVNLAMVLRGLLKRGNTPLPALAEDVIGYGRRNVTASAQWLSPRSPENEG
jgi:mannose/fructose-specific phosphotransferase system component IIA